jgi:hypothetical protein
MFEPGDWVKVPARRIAGGEFDWVAGQVIAPNGEPLFTSSVLVFVISKRQSAWWNQDHCRKMSEHEVMEELSSAS